MKEAVQHVASHDREVEREEVDQWMFGADSLLLGLRLWSEAGEPEEPVSSVFVHDRTYLRDLASPEKFKAMIVASGLLEAKGGDE